MSAAPGSTSRRPPRRQSSHNPGGSTRGKSALTVPSQVTHSSRYCQGRVPKVLARDSRWPDRTPTRPPSIFAAAVAGRGLPDGGQVERDPGSDDDGERQREDRGAARRPGARGPDEGEDEHRLGPREHSQREESGGGEVAAGDMREEPAGHQRRRERHLHARERAPEHRAGQRGEHAGDGGGAAVRRPLEREPRGQPGGGQRGGRAGHLGDERLARPRGGRARPSSRVQSGAVEPDTGTPGL